MKTILLLTFSSTLILSFTVLAQNYGVWREIDSMKIARVDHALVILPNGDVLASGNGVDSTQSSAEIYELSKDKWRYTTPMNIPRVSHNLVLLNTGKVLAIGGYKEQSCELYDPQTEIWTMTDSIPTFRYGGQTVTKLLDGRIMVAGGYYVDTTTWDFIILNKVDIYDPVTETWAIAAPMSLERCEHTATLLNDGRVLVTGGETYNFTTEQCEIYNPNTNIWESTGNMMEARSEHAALLLDYNRVFICGGDGMYPWQKSCEIYNVNTGIWGYASDMLAYRANPEIYFLENINKILIIGGDVLPFSTEDTWEIYDPIILQPELLESFPINQFLLENNVQLLNGNIFLAGNEEYDFNPMPYSWPTNRCWIFDTSTEVENLEYKAEEFQLYQNYPNPFNPVTTIGYNLKEQSKVELKVFDILANEVITLVDDIKQAGYHQAEFNTNNLEKGLSSGIYLYQIKARGTEESKSFWQKTNKMILLK